MHSSGRQSMRKLQILFSTWRTRGGVDGTVPPRHRRQQSRDGRRRKPVVVQPVTPAIEAA